MQDFFNYFTAMTGSSVLLWCFWVGSWFVGAYFMLMQVVYAYKSKNILIMNHVYEHIFFAVLMGMFQLLILITQFNEHGLDFLDHGWIGYAYMFISIINVSLSYHLLKEVDNG